MRRPTAEQAIAPPRARRVARLAHLAPPAPPAKRSESIAPQILHLGPPTSEAKIGPATAHLARFEAWKSDTGTNRIAFFAEKIIYKKSLGCTLLFFRGAFLG